MNTKDLAKKNESYIVEQRRYFHMHPELSLEEFETTEYIAKELDKMGIPYIRPTATGLIGTIEGSGPGQCVGLRADIDALNVTEKTTVDYKSLNEGKMHACGHDAHAAMLLGAAKILLECRNDFKGSVKVIFQPAEEVAQGAKELIAAGDWFNEVDNFFGAHIWSNSPSGTVSVEAGPRMAAADWFDIKVTGKSGHGSMPNQCVDAVVVASAIVMNLQTLVSRETSPMDPLVVTVGTIKGGTRFNIIAGDASMDGTNRYFSKDIANTIEADMTRIIEGTAALYQAKAVLDYRKVTPPLINEANSSALARVAALKVYDEEAIILSQPTTGGEDFAYYIQDKPGCFAFIGCANAQKGTDFPHHNECFNVDEAVLANGSALYAQYALDFLA